MWSAPLPSVVVIKEIVAPSGLNRVVAAVSSESIVAGPAGNVIASTTAVDRGSAVVAGYGVGTGAARDAGLGDARVGEAFAKVAQRDGFGRIPDSHGNKLSVCCAMTVGCRDRDGHSRTVFVVQRLAAFQPELTARDLEPGIID